MFFIVIAFQIVRLLWCIGIEIFLMVVLVWVSCLVVVCIVVLTFGLLVFVMLKFLVSMLMCRLDVLIFSVLW